MVREPSYDALILEAFSLNELLLGTGGWQQPCTLERFNFAEVFSWVPILAESDALLADARTRSSGAGWAGNRPSSFLRDSGGHNPENV